MIVGSVVLDTQDRGDRVWVQTQRPNDVAHAIYLERTCESRSVSPGDKLWWFRDRAYWTPKKAPFANKILMRKRVRGRLLR